MEVLYSMEINMEKTLIFNKAESSLQPTGFPLKTLKVK